MRDWYQLDETRESWVLLSLQCDADTGELDRWAFGVGNATHLVRTATQARADGADETTLLNTLSDAMAKAQTPGTLVVTPVATTLPILRQRYVANERVKTPSLQGFSHVSLEMVLDEFFGGEMPEIPPTDTHSIGVRSAKKNPIRDDVTEACIESLWWTWTHISPIVPAQTLTGEAL